VTNSRRFKTVVNAGIRTLAYAATYSGLSLGLPHTGWCESTRIGEDLQLEVSSQGAELTLKKPVTPETLMLEKPPRLVLDLPGVSVARGRSLPIRLGDGQRGDELGLFTGVRIGRHLDRTRVVFDLAVPLSKEIPVTVDGLTIRVGSPTIGNDGPSKDLRAEVIPSVMEVAKVETANVVAEAVIPTQVLENLSPGVPPPIATPSHSNVSEIESSEVVATEDDVATEDGVQVEASDEGSTVDVPLTTTDASLASLPKSETPLLSSEAAASAPIESVPNKEPEPEPLVAPPPTELKFSVSKMVVTFAHQARPVTDLVVKNRGSERLFMSTEVRAILMPGTTKESKSETVQLVASPRRFELAPDEERTVRLVLNRQLLSEDEAVYRVEILPSFVPFEFDNRRAVLNVATGVAVLVIAEPRDLAPQLEWKWTEDEIRVFNAGNANVLLDRGQACVGERCVSIPAHRIYPGSFWSMHRRLANGPPVDGANRIDSLRFMQRLGNDFQPLIVRQEN
jgi:P pilus assembly chaperone PapD